MNRESEEFRISSDIKQANLEVLQVRLEQAEHCIREVAASLAWNCFGECRAVHDGPIMPAQGALEMAREFLASQQPEGFTHFPELLESVQQMDAMLKVEGAQGEREAFEAHESRERRLSPADQKFWFRRGAVADYDIKSIDDAWKAWKARAALAQPALQCKKCGGTGDADSGGIHPWGEAAMVPCDCAHTERAQGKRTEDGDTIIDRLRLGGLTIDGDNAYKRDLLDCAVGALAFGFQGRPAPEETHWLHRFWEIGNAEREARAALAQPSPKCATCNDSEVVSTTDTDHNGDHIEIRCPDCAQPSPAPELERHLQQEVDILRIQRDAAQARVAELEQCLYQMQEAAKSLSAPVAQAGQVPEVSGIARAYDHPSAVILYLRKEPTDDDLRAIQEGLRVLAAAPQPAKGE